MITATMKQIINSISKRAVKIIVAIFIGVVLYISASLLFHLYPFAGAEKFPKPKNIILIIVDALRADRLGFMGYGRETSPALDAIARQGFVFMNFYSQSGWTLPSVASFFTGMLPAFHRVENYQDVLNDDEITLAEMLKSRGYKTVGLCANSIISKEAGFAQGFDLWKNMEYDDCMTRRAESYLDPSIPTPEELESDNLFDFSGFRYMRIEKRRSHGVQPGYFDRGRYEIKPGDFKPLSKIPVARSKGEIEPGKYRFGISLMSDKPGCTVDVIVREIGNNKKPAVLARNTFETGSEWKMFLDELRLNQKANLELIMIASSTGGETGGSFYVDTPFLFPAKMKEREGVFLYLHFMEAHEPNKISRHLEKRYLGIFNDNLLIEGDVSHPPGDPNHLTSCRALFPRWKEESDSLNWHSNRYDETIRFIDDQVRTIIDSLKKTNKYDDSLVIFTSDHGQEFFDHGWTGHGYSLYNELIDIPMLMIFPRLMMNGKGKEIQQNVQTIDLLPTLEALTGGDSFSNDTSAQQMSRSLLPLMLNSSSDWSEQPIFSSDIRNRMDSIILDNWKYIKKESACVSAELLFDNVRDTNERNPLDPNDLTAGQCENFRYIQKRHSSLAKAYQVQKIRKTLPHDKLNMDKLAQLGYINPHYVTEVDQDIDCFMAELKLIMFFLHIFGVR